MPFYGKALGNFLGGYAGGDSNQQDTLTDTIKCMLTTSSYTPNQDTHVFKTDVTNEVVGTGYTAGGKTMTTKTMTYDAPTNKTTFDADDVTWTAATITARYAVIYKDTGTGATSPLMGYVDFGSDQSSSGGDFTIAWNAAGIFTLTAT